MSANAKLYLKLIGSSSGWIKGESRDAVFPDQIELDDWKWSLNPADKDGGSPVPSLLRLGKLMDRSTTAMLSAMRNGESLTAVISLEEASRQQFRLIVTLEYVYITEYSFNAKSEDKNSEISEDWVLDYESIRFDHRSHAKEGMSTVQMLRPPGASQDAPSGVKEQLIKLALTLPADSKLSDIWRDIESAWEQRAITMAADAAKTREGK